VLPRTGLFLLALAVAGCPGLAAAQSPADEQIQLPDITVSVSFGSHFRTDYSGFSGPGATLPELAPWGRSGPDAPPPQPQSTGIRNTWMD
jgi:hypothetical protein